jgi:predicted permease
MAQWLDELQADVRYAVRHLWSTPAFTIVAAATLAIGIAATTAIFSVVHAVILNPLPIDDAGRVLVVGENFGGQLGSVSGGNFNDWRTRARSFSALAAFSLWNFNLATGDAPVRVLGARTTHEFFPLIGIAPELGRVYSAAEDRPGSERVVVLSHRLWVRQFEANPDAVGTSVRMDGQPYTIVGVMPASFDAMGTPEELWVPAAFTPERLAMHDEHFLTVVGRLAGNVSREQAAAELQAIYQQVHAELPADQQVRPAILDSLTSQRLGDVRQRLLVLFGAVTFVLLIACANVAHLLLARGGVRGHEIAVRAALGARRHRIIRQLLTESCVLAVLGGTMGVALAYVVVPVLVALSPDGIPRLDQAGVHASVLLFALAVSLASAIASGLMPAIVSTRLDLRSAVSEGGRTAPRSRERVRFVLVAGEVGVALLLLAGAGLLVRSALHLQGLDPGFNPVGVLTARITLPATGYEDPSRVVATFEDVVRRLTESPSVDAVAVTSSAPMGDPSNSNGLVPEGKTFDPQDSVDARLSIITQDYLRVMRIPLVSGRAFTDADFRGAPLVMMLNETAARLLFPGENAVGKRVSCCEQGPAGQPRLKLVVGLVGDVRGDGLQRPPRPEFYLPIAQAPDQAWTWVQRTMTVVVRGREQNAPALTGVVRDVVRQIDPTVPLYRIATMDERMQTAIAPTRFNTLLMALLSAIGLLLAAIGIYGVITYSVAQRQRELAIRVALGAPARVVMRMVIEQGMRPVLFGVTAGAVATLAGARVLDAYVFGITARDPLTLAGAVSLLVAAALVASVIPARRAIRVDPARTLASM